jgi:hypothetical protein
MLHGCARNRRHPRSWAGLAHWSSTGARSRKCGGMSPANPPQNGINNQPQASTTGVDASDAKPFGQGFVTGHAILQQRTTPSTLRVVNFADGFLREYDLAQVSRLFCRLYRPMSSGASK